MNRADRLRRVVPGAPAALITALAARPAAEVDLIVAALRQARRDERQHQAELRRQRKRDDRTYRNWDEADLSGRNLRLISRQGVRAATNLDALAGMAEARRLLDDGIAAAVASLRALGHRDEKIGQALGVSRQAVGQRFGRKGEFTADDLAAGGGTG